MLFQAPDEGFVTFMDRVVTQHENRELHVILDNLLSTHSRP
jgi:hypothetical protein